MLHFDDIEELVAHIFDKLDIDEPVTTVTDKDLAVEIMNELLSYEDVVLDVAKIYNDYQYNKEYFVMLLDKEDDYWHIVVEPAYDCDKQKYLGVDGYVLLHEDANSKALIDMQNNELLTPSDHEWFVIGEDDSFDSDDEDVDSTYSEETDIKEQNNIPSTHYNRKIVYKVNGEEVDKETYEKTSREIDKLYYGGIRDILDSFWKIFY